MKLVGSVALTALAIALFPTSKVAAGACPHDRIFPILSFDPIAHGPVRVQVRLVETNTTRGWPDCVFSTVDVVGPVDILEGADEHVVLTVSPGVHTLALAPGIHMLRARRSASGDHATNLQPVIVGVAEPLDPASRIAGSYATLLQNGFALHPGIRLEAGQNLPAANADWIVQERDVRTWLRVRGREITRTQPAPGLGYALQVDPLFQGATLVEEAADMPTRSALLDWIRDTNPTIIATRVTRPRRTMDIQVVVNGTALVLQRAGTIDENQQVTISAHNESLAIGQQTLRWPGTRVHDQNLNTQTPWDDQGHLRAQGRLVCRDADCVSLPAILEEPSSWSSIDSRLLIASIHHDPWPMMTLAESDGQAFTATGVMLPLPAEHDQPHIRCDSPKLAATALQFVAIVNCHTEVPYYARAQSWSMLVSRAPGATWQRERIRTNVRTVLAVGESIWALDDRDNLYRFHHGLIRVRAPRLQEILRSGSRLIGVGRDGDLYERDGNRWQARASALGRRTPTFAADAEFVYQLIHEGGEFIVFRHALASDSVWTEWARGNGRARGLFARAGRVWVHGEVRTWIDDTHYQTTDRSFVVTEPERFPRFHSFIP